MKERRRHYMLPPSNVPVAGEIDAARRVHLQSVKLSLVVPRLLR
jgi:hypothetical protein